MGLNHLEHISSRTYHLFIKGFDNTITYNNSPYFPAILLHTINTTYSGGFIMYKDIFESIRNEAEKRNLRERTIQLYCSDVSYFLRWIGKMFLILHLKMRKVFLLPNVWKEGLLKLTITIGLQSSSYIKRC